MSLGTLLSGSAQLFWPARCAACNGNVPDDVIFCGDCNLSINPLVGACSGCALPYLRSPSSLHRCLICRRIPFPFCEGHAAFEYGAALAEAIVRMKHGARRDLARRLGRLLAPTLAQLLARARFGLGDAIIPVPLHASRLRKRGFNQALELARAALLLLTRHSAFVGAPIPRLERSLLLRTRATRELGHSGPAARLAEVAGAFTVANSARVRDRRFLLIDDVFTTGATFSECASALRAAGARDVYVLALARAV
jgi:ComF family protein